MPCKFAVFELLGCLLTWNSSSGLLLYAALVDLLAEDFLSEEANRLLTSKDKIAAFAWVLAGGESYSCIIYWMFLISLAAGMSVVGAFA